MGLSKYWSHSAALLFVASILMRFAAVWGVPEETSEVDDDVDDQNGDDDQPDAMVADMVGGGGNSQWRPGIHVPPG